MIQDNLIVAYHKIPRWLKHMSFWLIFVSFFALLWGSFSEKYDKEFISQFMFLPPKLLASYVTLYILIPRFLLTNKILQFFIWITIVLLASGLLNWAIAIYIENPVLYPNEDFGGLWNPKKILKSATYIYPVVVLCSLIKLFKHWYKNQQMAQQFEQDKLSAELKFLKAQVHPHFLFNTLNNLYALTLKSSEKAPEVVLKLSDLLNYMLYECNTDRVPLKKEIELVENYVELEKLRYGDRLDTTFNKEIEGENYIAPMLILPFIENSFKHGVSGETENSWVSIDITVKDGLLTLKVDNSKSSELTKDEREYREGIGLNNVKRRLELLYGGAYDLKILDTDESYLVVLKLELDND
ncbi:sensor histidine kinase [Fulvivirga lutea]|uniref:sensor histidine kinase n=1 Tax=Fulvivirga lutea TaxID=2810512 RepID=UPI001F42081C|nr:histidine kinase [Fulvivirga lutea]